MDASFPYVVIFDLPEKETYGLHRLHIMLWWPLSGLSHQPFSIGARWTPGEPTMSECSSILDVQ